MNNQHMGFHSVGCPRKVNSYMSQIIDIFRKFSLDTSPPPPMLQRSQHFIPVGGMMGIAGQGTARQVNSRMKERSANVRRHGKGGVNAVIYEKD